jgi:hypothetical protein
MKTRKKPQMLFKCRNSEVASLLLATEKVAASTISHMPTGALWAAAAASIVLAAAVGQPWHGHSTHWVCSMLVRIVPSNTLLYFKWSFSSECSVSRKMHAPFLLQGGIRRRRGSTDRGVLEVHWFLQGINFILKVCIDLESNALVSRASTC